MKKHFKIIKRHNRNSIDLKNKKLDIELWLTGCNTPHAYVSLWYNNAFKGDEGELEFDMNSLEMKKLTSKISPPNLKQIIVFFVLYRIFKVRKHEH